MEIFQSVIAARGAAPATAIATPRLTAAVFREFMTRTSRWENHAINRGPVDVINIARPRPYARRSTSITPKLGARNDSASTAMDAQAMS